MIIAQTPYFKKQKKKLHVKQVKALDEAVTNVAENPIIGELKKGDLRGIRVHKFKIAKQEYLLAYMESKKQITLLEVGTHENFYRELKKHVE
ncbi:MAG: type II toxin-antitoxin system RelE/ParE family toxin [Gammaproteobacteria bacterium]|nr:type II toxin-antitoxin system RelE/ParE family toxin [Gammaproteobacteria bacterium]